MIKNSGAAIPQPNSPAKEATTISLQEEILKTMETILQRNTNDHPQSRDVASVVTKIHQDQYEVQIDGTVYLVKNGVGINLNVGDPVWIHIPNGNITEMFIMAKK